MTEEGSKVYIFMEFMEHKSLDSKKYTKGIPEPIVAKIAKSVSRKRRKRRKKEEKRKEKRNL